MPPTPETDFLLLPRVTPVSVALEPVPNGLNSLLLLNKAETMLGLDAWVSRTADALSPAQRHRNLLVFEGMYYAIQPQRRWPSFMAYLDDLAAQEPTVLRDRLLRGACY